MEVCAYRLRRLHRGYKLKHTVRTYNLTVNHQRRILSTTKGHPATFNDKTLITYDEFVKTLKDSKYDDKFEFELYDYNEDGKVIRSKYKGVWLIVDNGYLRWSVTVPPIKKTNLRKEIQFSQWLESMRKDVECAFGILKGRWRCLRYGIKLHGIENCDKIWLTCCALHNMLLEVDGLAKRWEHGVQSVYESKLDHYNDLPSLLQKLAKPDSSRNFDIADISYGNDVNCTVVETVVQDIEVPSEVVELSPDVVKSVGDISLHQF